jgi:hypothetical protein
MATLQQPGRTALRRRGSNISARLMRHLGVSKNGVPYHSFPHSTCNFGVYLIFGKPIFGATLARPLQDLFVSMYKPLGEVQT